MNNILTTTPLSLYIHIPWCTRKCPYCDFNSYEVKAAPIENYIEAMISDLKQDSVRVANRPLLSIYIGGGTPSLLSAKTFDKLLTAIRNIFDFGKNIEISIEANPGTIDKQKCIDYKNIGINRLSLGVQSFQDDKLFSLGRIHNAQVALETINYALDAGFDNLNIDIMFGIPGQTLEDAIFDVNKAISLNVPHISWYQLTIEPKTPFYTNPPVLPNEDVIMKIRTAGHKLFEEHKYKQYEVSAYCKAKKYQCKHNVNYWEFGDYLGVGAGAHGKITDLAAKKIIRTAKKANPDDYLTADKMSLSLLAEERVMTEKELPVEFMMNALRLYRDIPISLFTERTGLSVDVIMENLKKAEELKLIKLNDKKITTTKKGKEFLNDLLEIFANI
jgi:oxygen-independent coproporphyrinogen-3 oxidase